jgi:hypothetical protein
VTNDDNSCSVNSNINDSNTFNSDNNNDNDINHINHSSDISNGHQCRTSIEQHCRRENCNFRFFIVCLCDFCIQLMKQSLPSDAIVTVGSKELVRNCVVELLAFVTRYIDKSLSHIQSLIWFDTARRVTWLVKSSARC